MEKLVAKLWKRYRSRTLWTRTPATRAGIIKIYFQGFYQRDKEIDCTHKGVALVAVLLMNLNHLQLHQYEIKVKWYIRGKLKKIYKEIQKV